MFLVRLPFAGMSVCLFRFFFCVWLFFLQASAYQNTPLLYLLHLSCSLLLNFIFTLLRNPYEM